jgi:vacuolar-type H+-ATPase subunit H
MDDLEIVKKIKEAEEAATSETVKLSEKLKADLENIEKTLSNNLKEQREILEKDYEKFIESQISIAQKKADAVISEARERAAKLKLKMDVKDLYKMIDSELMRLLE